MEPWERLQSCENYLSKEVQTSPHILKDMCQHSFSCEKENASSLKRCLYSYWGLSTAEVPIRHKNQNLSLDLWKPIWTFFPEKWADFKKTGNRQTKGPMWQVRVSWTQHRSCLHCSPHPKITLSPSNSSSGLLTMWKPKICSSAPKCPLGFLQSVPLDSSSATFLTGWTPAPLFSGRAVPRSASRDRSSVGNQPAWGRVLCVSPFDLRTVNMGGFWG